MGREQIISFDDVLGSGGFAKILRPLELGVFVVRILISWWFVVVVVVFRCSLRSCATSCA